MSGNSSSTITTRFLILSDTHNFEFADNPISSPLTPDLPKADVVLHCGDLTHCGGASSYKKAIRLLSAFDAELKLVIAGNHDLELDKEFWESYLDLEDGDEIEDHAKAIEVMTGPLAKEAGLIYLEEGTYTFTLKTGAVFKIYASPYSPKFGDFAFSYKHNEDRLNDAHQVADGNRSIARNPMPAGVDIVMTHGPPKGLLDECPDGNFGCENALQAVRRVRPRLHCFGHIHEGNGAVMMDWENGGNHSGICNDYPKPIDLPALVDGQQTLMVNAAIMNEKNEPVNAPWLVDLELPLVA